MTQRASRLFLLAAFLWLGGFSALATRFESLETRVGGYGLPARDGPGPAASQALATATGCGESGWQTAPGQSKWKFYGPDLNGVYGGMHGVGGLEAVATGPQQSSPVVNDIRGNGYAIYNVTQGSLSWYPSRPTAFGAATGYQPLPLADGATVAQASAWRSKWADITGLYWLGSRYYDPTPGSWLSFDPEWNGRDPDGFSFCGGDSVNYFDPDGRCIEGAANYVYNGGVAGQVLRGVSSYLNGYANSSAGGGYFTGAAGTIANELAGMSAPSTYVNGTLSFGNNINTVYQSGGVVDAASYGLTSWNMGAVMSGAANQDQVTGQPVGDWYQRGTVISGGVAGTAGVASAGLGGITALTSTSSGGPVTIGDILAGHSSDTMIHLTTATEDELATATFPNFTPPHTTPGVFQGSSWVQLGDVSHMTLPEYQELVVGPGAAGYGSDVTAFVTHPPSSVFTPVNVPNLGGVQEFINGPVVKPGTYVPLPGKP